MIFCAVIELIPQDSSPYPKIILAYARGNKQLKLGNDEDIGGSLLFGGPCYDKYEPKRSQYLHSHRNSVPLSQEMHIYTITWSPSKHIYNIYMSIYIMHVLSWNEVHYNTTNKCLYIHFLGLQHYTRVKIYNKNTKSIVIY